MSPMLKAAPTASRSFSPGSYALGALWQAAPGWQLTGNLAYSELYLAMTRHFPPSALSALIASHADPDIIASLDRWTTATRAKIYISTVWERFVPHFCKPGKTTGRVVGIPDAGLRIRIGR